MADFVRNEKCAIEIGPHIFMNDELVSGIKGRSTAIELSRARICGFYVQTEVLCDLDGKRVRLARIRPFGDCFAVKFGCSLASNFDGIH